MKILTVFGTHPDAIKMAPLVKLLAAEREIKYRIPYLCHCSAPITGTGNACKKIVSEIKNNLKMEL